MADLIHPITDKPMIGEMIVVMNNGSWNMRKNTRLVKMTESDWPMIKLGSTQWCYFNEVLRSSELLQKYVCGFNHYREEVRKIAKLSTNKAIQERCEKVVEECAELIKG